MVKIKPFAGIRPPKELAAEVSSRPYDVLNSQEAKAEATERSLLHIIKPEIDFDPIADEHDEKVYKKAVENFKKWRDNKWLVQDGEEHYYIYAQTMNGRTQYGLAMCCYYEDYWSGKIKKHELTRIEKEEDRMKHVELQQANLEPVREEQQGRLRFHGRSRRLRPPFLGDPRQEDQRPYHRDFRRYSCSVCG